MIMVESGREYVLQWPGHAAYVTERFSGLLARQALVDVTLLCEEQKLRVHKLVLASCSLYFEEILGNLGPEPTILLQDLNFSILKAMIEFMYCGETTVSHVHMPSLLTAARLFKIRELESLVEKMVGSHTQDLNDNDEQYLPKEVFSGAPARINGLRNSSNNNDDTGIRVSFSKKQQQPQQQQQQQQQQQSSYESCSDDSSENTYPTEESIVSSDSPNHCLYEEQQQPQPIVNDRLAPVLGKKQLASARSRAKSVESVTDSMTSSLDCSEKDNSSSEYERCCDFVQASAKEQQQQPQRGVYLSPERAETTITTTTSSGSITEVNRVGQCSRVYTHKRRKANGDNTTASSSSSSSSSKRHAQVLPQPPSPKRIDLVDESSNDESAPLTLATNLDTESSDYVLSFSSESIQSIVGCSYDFCSPSSFDLLNPRTGGVVEPKKEPTEEEEAPVLRRSVRLNQQEPEEPQQQPTYAPRLRSKLRDDKKSCSGNKLFPRGKRKLERRVVPNVKVILASQRKAASNNGHGKQQRKAPAKSLGKPSKQQQQQQQQQPTEDYHHQTSSSSSTSTTVNRALWGDMSDVAEDGELANEEFLEYSTSAEIPFAVGLLPLRAALEKMQATLDHQPRKTRSSSTKQESASSLLLLGSGGGLKRKASPGSSSQQEVPTTATTTRKQEDDEGNPSAVCHIEIRTSQDQQCSRPRKRSLSDGASLERQAARL